jgi:hypothetical protein
MAEVAEKRNTPKTILFFRALRVLRDPKATITKMGEAL